MSDRARFPTSELSTEGSFEYRERPVFTAGRGGAPPTVLCLFVLVALWAPAASVAAAEPPTPEAEAEAPPPLSKPPRLVQFVEAERPASLAPEERADVLLTIDVDDKGHVSDVAVATSAGAALDAAAVAAARRFTFEPAEAGGKPVPVRITYAYHFLPAPPPAPVPVAAAPSAPTLPLTGVVLRKGDRVPIAGVAVIAGGSARVVTGEDGRFAFEALPAGETTLQFRSPTTTPADTNVTLTPGKRLEMTVYVDQKERYASVVRGRRALVETVEQTLSIGVAARPTADRTPRTRWGCGCSRSARGRSTRPHFAVDVLGERAHAFTASRRSMVRSASATMLRTTSPAGSMASIPPTPWPAG